MPWGLWPFDDGPPSSPQMVQSGEASTDGQSAQKAQVAGALESESEESTLAQAVHVVLEQKGEQGRSIALVGAELGGGGGESYPRGFGSVVRALGSPNGMRRHVVSDAQSFRIEVSVDNLLVLRRNPVWLVTPGPSTIRIEFRPFRIKELTE